MGARIYQFPIDRAGRAELTKKQLAREIGRSVRWIELMQRDHGLPFTRLSNGRCRYSLSAVEAWREKVKPRLGKEPHGS